MTPKQAKELLPIVEAIVLEEEVERASPWKDAVIDELINCCIYSAEHDKDPRKAVVDAINWNCRLALDPQVSREAQDLIDLGVRHGLEAAAGVAGDARIRVEALPVDKSTVLQEQVRKIEARKDAAYEERNRVVALLAALLPSVRARTAIEGGSEDWHGCVYVTLPNGQQASWHYRDSQAHLFAHVPEGAATWDGHTTPEKYERIAECCAKLVEHVAKGDPRDVAAYCAFLWHHGESTAPASPEGETLPPLPEPKLKQSVVRLNARHEETAVWYSGDQMRAYGQACVAAMAKEGYAQVARDGVAEQATRHAPRV